MIVPADPKIYHIVHEDRLESILADAHLWCDAEMVRRNSSGTAIGMSSIKRRRLEELTLASHPGLHVGDCVPFYFCPRSVMLYLLHMANHPDLDYHDGQEPIVHLEASVQTTVEWATREKRRWAFTLTNAGSRFFEDRADLAQLQEIDWDAVRARDWMRCKDGKQAEFLVECSFPWELVERIGVSNRAAYERVLTRLAGAGHSPSVEVLRDWYY